MRLLLLCLLVGVCYAGSGIKVGGGSSHNNPLARMMNMMRSAPYFALSSRGL